MGIRVASQPDMNVPYSLSVSERKVNREAWAHEIARLIQEEDGGNKSAFARRVGIGIRSVDRWLARTVNVSEESVRDVCRALNLPPLPMLVRVGYYQEGEAWAPSTAELLAEDEAALRLIDEADETEVPPSLKRQLRAHVVEERARHEAQRLAEIQRLIDLARRAR
jgi:hypothetical protein